MRRSSILILIGAICILCSSSLALSNEYTDNQAKTRTNAVNIRLTQVIKEKSVVTAELKKETVEYSPDYIRNPDIEMPTVLIDGYEYVGTLSIPVLLLELPIIRNISNKNLKIAPSVYKGSAYKDNMVIAGHNYKSHFGYLSSLIPEDEIIFTDMDGNKFRYLVSGIEIIDGTDTEAMDSGNWDLTLFTCTYSGTQRIAIRCLNSNNSSGGTFYDKE